MNADEPEDDPNDDRPIWQKRVDDEAKRELQARRSAVAKERHRVRRATGASNASAAAAANRKPAGSGTKWRPAGVEAEPRGRAAPHAWFAAAEATALEPSAAKAAVRREAAKAAVAELSAASIRSMKVAELRDALAARKLPTDGLKPALAARLLQHRSSIAKHRTKVAKAKAKAKEAKAQEACGGGFHRFAPPKLALLPVARRRCLPARGVPHRHPPTRRRTTKRRRLRHPTLATHHRRRDFASSCSSVALLSASPKVARLPARVVRHSPRWTWRT